MTSTELTQCVQYFTQASMPEMVAGGVFVLGTIVFSLTKLNLPSTVKKVGSIIVDLAKKYIDKK